MKVNDAMILQMVQINLLLFFRATVKTNSDSISYSSKEHFTLPNKIGSASVMLTIKISRNRLPYIIKK